MEDFTQQALELRRKAAGSPGGPTPPLGLHLVMGDPFQVEMANQTRNAEQGRVAYVRGIYVKAA